MKACIIGAGVGGLATGAMLAENGWEVEIYEKEKIAGGRAMSLKLGEEYFEMLKKFNISVLEVSGEYEEKELDLGFHLIGGGKKGGCARLLKNLGIEVEFIGSKIGFIGKEINYPFLSGYDKIKMLPRIIQLLTTRKSKIEEMKKNSMEEMIKKYGKGKMKDVLEIFPRLVTTVNDLSKISAGEFFFAQRELLGGEPVVYPKNGLGEISKKLKEYIEGKGGKIFFGEKVDEILIEDGIANGIRTGEEEKYYDAIISTIPLQKIFSIADEKHFPKEWANYIKNLRPTASLVSYHAVDFNGLKNKSFVFIEKNCGFEGNDVVGMIDFKKEGIIQSYAICSPEEAKSKKKMEELRKIIEKNLEKLIQGKKIKWYIYSAVRYLDGVAKTIDCIKPNVTTPLKNLYVGGDYVNSKGVGVNCAVDSANLISSILLA
ncbi:MAG: NAD(P)/FAD-dependent oxidoreductase [Thermoplasmatales archaeon]|nr:NAD(P)/FAD-dependent oxidoreductase [Thermoplasmatales archaeon]